MNKLSIFFIFLYVIHVLFSKALFEFDFSMKNIGKKSLMVSHLSMLVIAYLLIYPNLENLVIAFLFSLISTIGYLIKFSNSKNRTQYFQQIFVHFLLSFVPLLLVIFSIKWDNYKVTWITYISIIYFIFLKIYNNKLYEKGISI
jgi:hypothetical protein